ncbi:MAG TPA: 50S ribosomal protein L23 [Nitrospinota bacterium]|nr:50S ribosomal protein L23 [Nitrospinota bacterium]
MRDPFVIVKRPVITEKTTLFTEKENKVVFQVDANANKKEIKKAISNIFNVDVLDVHIVMIRGKKRRLRFKEGKRPDWKKAIITLKEGDKIEFFEGVK